MFQKVLPLLVVEAVEAKILKAPQWGLGWRSACFGFSKHFPAQNLQGELGRTLFSQLFLTLVPVGFWAKCYFRLDSHNNYG